MKDLSGSRALGTKAEGSQKGTSVAQVCAGLELASLATALSRFPWTTEGRPRASPFILMWMLTVPASSRRAAGSAFKCQHIAP